MTKKRKKGEMKVNDELLAALNGASTSASKHNEGNIEQLAEKLLNQLPEEEKETFFCMMNLLIKGLTPEEYAEYYYLLHGNKDDLVDPFDDDPHGASNPFGFPVSFSTRGYSEVEEYQPLKDAANKTLVIKIQMKGVNKPPMWREVEIPANADFEELHDVIQEVTGLEQRHLWVFNKKAYDNSLAIGEDEDITHVASDTPLTTFLQKKGDKLEYTYDFGDDWCFTVEVKQVLNKKSEFPVCLKFKGDLNALEDFGGIWAYIEARGDLENWEKLSKEEREQHAEFHGFYSPEDYYEFLQDNVFNLGAVNKDLQAL